jgi:predicted  nucleic acid-binding Zn-ribbon protein
MIKLQLGTTNRYANVYYPELTIRITEPSKTFIQLLQKILDHTTPKPRKEQIEDEIKRLKAEIKRIKAEIKALEEEKKRLSQEIPISNERIKSVMKEIQNTTNTI